MRRPRLTFAPLLLTIATLVALVTLPPAQHAGAQEVPLPRPALDWKTTESRHFVFHYPTELRAWTLATAPKMDAIHGAVRRLVGYAPTRKVHVIVEDPLAESNGSAWPILRAPNIYLWPTPPEPTSAIGNNRSWGEILGVHEFAHVAHLNRPSRQRFWSIRSPFGRLGLGPIPVKTPRWMIEGYATFVEGRLTGHGRPHGVWRPAILRQWAREGRMPTYAGLNGTDGFYQGSLAYLAGSAYIEWLAAQRGDSSFALLWRRMTAKTERTFDEAFTGVYGAPPAQLYGRFVAELTEDAMDAEELIAGADTSAAGETEQRFEWYTGEPAVSPDGKLVAMHVAERRGPTRVVVLPTAPDTVTDRERTRRRRMLERDPQDVPAIEIGPRPRKPVATLWPRRGSSFARPRWFKDGERLLLVHRDWRPDGASRLDLYVWNRKSGATRRVTRGAAIRSADPSPDGRQAAAVRCLNGDCDLVLVDLANGAVRTLAKGSPTVSWYRPRWSPDGRTIAAAVQREGLWRVATVDPASGAVTELYPDERRANRYDAAWTPDGRALVVVSETSGIPQLERIDLATRAATPVTRVLGAATGPDVEPSGRGVYFLSLYARGMDLKRVVPDSATTTPLARLDTALAPATSVGIVPADTFTTGTLSREREYGLGPRRHLVLPFNLYAVEGNLLGLTLAGTDPVGRLSYTLSGGWGLDYTADGSGIEGFVRNALASEGMWRGGSLRAAWRGMHPNLEGDVWWTQHQPSEQRIGAPGFTRSFRTLYRDHRQAGARLGARLDRTFGWRSHTYRAGLVWSQARLANIELGEEQRQLAYATLGGSYRFSHKRSYAGVRWSGHGDMGTTFGQEWKRALLGAGVFAGGQEGGIALDATWGRAYDAPQLEEFTVGGVQPPFFDASVMPQIVPVPGLPSAFAAGSRVATWRLSLGGDLFEPFLLGIAAGERLPALRHAYDGFYKIVGFETDLQVPSISLIRSPGARVQAGVSYTLDEPLKKRLRVYGGVSYRP